VKVLNKPQVCAVYVDAGKAQTRQEDEGKGPGVRGQAWADTKVACLVTYEAKEHAEDPQPEVPKKLMDRETVKELCRQMALIHGKSQEPSEKTREKPADPGSKPAEEKFARPEPLVRIVPNIIKETIFQRKILPFQDFFAESVRPCVLLSEVPFYLSLVLHRAVLSL
jgi:hypothetical protein